VRMHALLVLSSFACSLLKLLSILFSFFVLVLLFGFPLSVCIILYLYNFVFDEVLI
jgi:hypothetical protein